MRLYFNTTLAVINLLVTLGCSSNYDDEWTVATIGVPKEITPKVANINMGLYVLKQTHEPIFRAISQTEYKSKILSRWTRNENNTEFIFCPDKSIEFQPGTHLTSGHLKATVLLMAKEEVLNPRLTEESNCLDIKFEKPCNNFVKILSDYKYAPSIKSAQPNWEDGLGPFKISSIENGKILLTRKNPVKNGYNSIAFIDYKSKDDPLLQRSDVEDVNRVLISDFPAKIKNDFQSYQASLLQSVNLVINIKNPETRDIIFNCLPIDKLRRAFMEGQSDFMDITSPLPVGVIGGKRGLVNQVCNLKGVGKFNFVNWKTGNETKLKDLFTEFRQKTGIEVKIVQMPVGEFVDKVFKDRALFDLYIAAMDATSPSVLPFLDSMIDPKQRFIDYEIIGSASPFAAIKNLEGIRSIDTQVEHLIQIVMQSKFFLPLYQELRVFYYPKHLKQFEVGRDFLEYPEIGEIKL